MAFFDHHCHLSGLPEGQELLDGARSAGVVRVIDVGTTVEDSRRAAAWAADRDNVWATAGVHPHDAAGGIDGLAELLSDAVAVGECGLDYHYDHSPRNAQRDVFAEQIRLAHQHDLPLVIHTREAWPDTFALLDAERWPARTVLHCFTGGPEEAERCLANGAWLSFSGIVTFPGAVEVREAARLVPAGRYLVETDTPYLAPVPHRGKRNRPAWVTDVARGLAEVRADDPAEVEAAAFAATHAAYGLEPPTG
ncbi:MAG: TatD family hydrolase [Microthrixaceae bacterium]